MERVYVIVGPTATGKTALAVATARALDGEVVTADSAQVYKGMDIGTAKPSVEERQGIAHHMIDLVPPNADYSAAQYQKQAKECILDILSRGKKPIVAGGTGLYINALTYSLDFSQVTGDEALRRELEQLDGTELYNMLLDVDEEAAGRIHPNNKRRVIRALEIAKNGKRDEYEFDRKNDLEYDFKIIGLDCPRDMLYERINNRVGDMMKKQGLPDEVQRLTDQFGNDHNSFQAIGYKELIAYLQGEADLAAAADLIKRNTRRFAKRQLTWFRRDDRIRWYDIHKNSIDEIAEMMTSNE